MSGEKNILSVTVDIEDWFHLPNITGAPSSKYKDIPDFFSNWHSRYDYLSENTKQVLNLLDELKIQSTFFVVADIVENYPGLVERIADRGHEIACHGLHHACKIHPITKKPLFTKAEFKERTIIAKKVLEKASGQIITGYRAPNAYVAGWMLDILEEIGFQYDSSVSVNSIYNKTDSSLKSVNTRPYYPIYGGLETGSKERGILEIPWPYFNMVLKWPTSGGPVLRYFGSRYILKGLNASLKRGNSIIYFHPIDISDETFPMNGTIPRKIFWINKNHKILEKIRYTLNHINHQTATLKELRMLGGDVLGSNNG